MVSSCTTVMYPEKESDMSFSSEVKEELAKHISPARHCQIAELAALMNFSGQYGRSAEGDFMIGFQTENEAVVRKGFTLLKKTYNIDTDVKISEEQMRSVIDKIGRRAFGAGRTDPWKRACFSGGQLCGDGCLFAGIAPVWQGVSAG